MYILCRFQGPPALCGCVAAACGASVTSEKNTPLDFVEYVSCGFSQFLTISRPPKPCSSVSQLPAALRRPQKKHAPGFLEHVSCGFCRFLSFLSISGSPKPLLRSLGYKTANPPQLRPTAPVHPPPPCPRGGVYYPIQSTLNRCCFCVWKLNSELPSLVVHKLN